MRSLCKDGFVDGLLNASGLESTYLIQSLEKILFSVLVETFIVGVDLSNETSFKDVDVVFVDDPHPIWVAFNFALHYRLAFLLSWFVVGELTFSLCFNQDIEVESLFLSDKVEFCKSWGDLSKEVLVKGEGWLVLIHHVEIVDGIWLLV